MYRLKFSAPHCERNVTFLSLIAKRNQEWNIHSNLEYMYFPYTFLAFSLSTNFVTIVLHISKLRGNPDVINYTSWNVLIYFWSAFPSDGTINIVETLWPLLWRSIDWNRRGWQSSSVCPALGRCPVRIPGVAFYLACIFYTKKNILCLYKVW